MAASENLQAVVNDLLLLPNGDDLTHGLFHATPFYDKMKAKVDHLLGGAEVKWPFQFAKHAVGRSSTPYVPGASASLDQFRYGKFPLHYFPAADLISNIEIRQSSDAEAANILKSKIVSMKKSIVDDINLAHLFADADDDFYGIPAIWLSPGGLYGGLARPTKANPGLFFSHIAATAAYDVDGNTYGLSEFGGTGDDVEVFETRWDCSGVSVAASGASGKPELVVMLVSRLLSHIGDSTDQADKQVLLVAADVHHMFKRYMNTKSTALKHGGEVSITANGKGGLVFDGIEVQKDKALTAGTVYALNTEFLHWGSVDGFAPSKISPKVKDRADLNEQQQISDMVALTMVCSNGTRVGWLEGLNQLAD
jgi:hypothetical protein